MRGPSADAEVGRRSQTDFLSPCSGDTARLLQADPYSKAPIDAVESDVAGAVPHSGYSGRSRCRARLPGASRLASATAKTFEGVWKVTKVVITGPNARTDSNPQPSLAMFARGYYSILRDNSRGPRKTTPRAKSPGKPTDAEKIAKYEEWAPYSASAGTYEVKGDTLITHNVVAKQASGMTATELATFKFVGDTFVLRPPPGPDAPPGETVERTYTRVR